MSSRLLKIFALLLVVMPVLGHVSLAQEKRHKVVIAVTSGDEADWKLTMGNTRNLLTALGAEVTDVEIVAYGPGLSILKKGSVVESDIQALIAQHVKFVACENSLRSQHVTMEELQKGVGSVPSGVTEVVLKQEQGYAYIKGGK